ncbi:copper amine oxidase N-terminal domain-containing protein [Paenibacillus ginsengarvi]|nr:copper amine oxidase N-terminal domain-containing protein [Paenibacillus ginsengarvi]
MLNKLWMRIGLGVLVFGLMLQPYAMTKPAAAASAVYWSTPKSATYSPLYGGVMMRNNELSAGGMSLDTLSITTKQASADLIMSETTIAARDIIRVDETLEAVTVSPSAGFGSWKWLEGDAVYLITLHDGTYAKIRIDRVGSSSIKFSFVTEAPAPKAEAPSKTAAENKATAPAAKPVTESPAKAADNKPAENKPAENKAADSSQAGGDESPALKFLTDLLTASPDAKPIKTTKPNIRLQLYSNIMYVNDVRFTLENNQSPRLEQDTTMVPLRVITEALGAKVYWDGSDQKITIELDGTTIIVKIDSKYASINGVGAYMDVPPQKYGDFSFVPVRFISENLKQKVDFDPATYTVTINGSETTGVAVSGGSSGQQAAGGAGGGQQASNTSGSGASESSAKTKTEAGDPTDFIGAYNLFIPGGSYTSDNYATEIRTVTTFAGSPDGTLVIGSDGTFAFDKSTYNWNPQAKEYNAGNGTWSRSNDTEYPIVLVDRAAGKTYKVGKSTAKLGGDILVYEEGVTWEVGTRK